MNSDSALYGGSDIGNEGYVEEQETPFHGFRNRARSHLAFPELLDPGPKEVYKTIGIVYKFSLRFYRKTSVAFVPFSAQEPTVAFLRTRPILSSTRTTYTDSQ